MSVRPSGNAGLGKEQDGGSIRGLSCGASNVYNVVSKADREDARRLGILLV